MSTAYPLPQQPQPKPWWKKWWAWLLICGIILALLIGGLFLLDKWSRAELERMNTEIAVKQCEDDVTDKAKYPGGVEFVEPIDITTKDDVDAEVLTYGANGEVDFPNGFGTPVRKSYTCIVLIEGDTGEVRHSNAMVF